MRFILIILSCIILTPIFGMTEEESSTKGIAVFIPGVMAGSPIYEELNSGVRMAVANNDVIVKTIEGGFNTAEWPEKVKEIAATGQFDLIISSNPSMPQVFQEVSVDFPDQKFLCLDGYTQGNPNIYTAQFKQSEQAYMAGYMAGLVTLSELEGANKDKKVGMIVSQHYPILDEVLIPGFKKGLYDVDPEITVDLRVIGNWYDATKAGELTSIMVSEGSDVFLSISGGATQGVISKCQDLGKYLIHFDSNGYNKAQGTVLGSTIVRQHDLTYKLVSDYIAGTLPFGSAETFSAKDGYVDFILDDPGFQDHVPKAIKDEMTAVVRKIKQ